MTDRLADMFEAFAYGLHAAMREFFYWLFGRVFNIPASTWD